MHTTPKNIFIILLSLTISLGLVKAAYSSTDYAQYYDPGSGITYCYICPTPPPPPPPTCIADGDASYQEQCNNNASECCSGRSNNGVCGSEVCSVQ